MLAKPPMAQQQAADAGPLLSCGDGPVMVGRCRACEQNGDGPMLANQQWPYIKMPMLAQCCHKASAQYWWAGAGPVSKTTLDQCWQPTVGQCNMTTLGQHWPGVDGLSGVLSNHEYVVTKSQS